MDVNHTMKHEKLAKLLPKPRCVEEQDGTLAIGRGAAAKLVCTDSALAEKLLAHLFGDVFMITADADACALTVTQSADMDTAGAHTITVGDTVEIVAADYEGVATALQTLAEIADRSADGVVFPRCRIEDAPFKAQRGIHFLLPPADMIDDFLNLLDAMAALKYNMIILETGGAVELDRHPEVNTAWTKFCRDAREYPRGPQGLQGSEAYWKDSTHVEVGGSGIMKKRDLRRIVDHCAMLGVEIVPEIQALSHCYYLTMAHPEIAERPYERWPDSYCPSNEYSYTLYEEVAEEILEVLQPKRVSIGHDEVRVLGECPLCRQKSGHELLAKDINRLYDFYNKRGIQIMMWGEMLQNFTNWKGMPAGGVEHPETVDRYGRRYKLGATYKAAQMIPKDILVIDWYHSQAADTEKGYHENGFTEILGNFRGSQIANYDERARFCNVQGAEVSTWCMPSEYELTFNGWMYELVFSAMVLWQDNYHDGLRDEFSLMVDHYMPILQSKISGPRGFDGTLDTLSVLAAVPGEQKDITYRFGTIDADTAAAVTVGGLTPLAEGDCLHIEGDADSLVFFHAAPEPMWKRITTWSFYDKKDRIPAKYAIDYDDGMCITCTVEFGAPFDSGAAIGDMHAAAGFVRQKAEGEMLADIDDKNVVNEDKLKISPMFVPKDPWRGALVYACRYAELDTPDGIRTVYAYEWKNPYPGHRIKSVRFFNEPKCPLEAQLYAVALVK